MNSKQCAGGSKWPEHKKQKNEIYFEYKISDVARELNYSKQTYPSNKTTLQVEKPLGYNCSVISMLGYSGSRIDPSISQVRHIKMKALIT